MDAWKTWDALKQRKSFDLFDKKFKPEAGAVESALSALGAAQQGQTDGPIKEAINALYDASNNATQEIQKIATKTPKGWVAKADVKPEDFTKTHEAFTKAQETLHKFLSGDAAHKLGDVEVKAPAEITKAYGEVTKATEAASKIMNGLFGKVRVEGWGATLNHNLNFMDTAAMEGRGGTVAFRAVASTAGVGLIGDAVLRSKSGDEKRSVMGRVLEGLTGAGLLVGGALAGAAR
jgi:hypothetical protein